MDWEAHALPAFLPFPFIFSNVDLTFPLFACLSKLKLGLVPQSESVLPVLKYTADFSFKKLDLL